MQKGIKGKVQKRIKGKVQKIKKKLKKTFVVLSFMALEIMKNGLTKKQNKGTISSWGAGGSRRNGPRTISKYFFIFEPFPYVILLLLLFLTILTTMTIIICT